MSTEQKKDCCACKCITECDVLTWKNPIETGKLFGASLLAILFIKNVNILTFLSKTLYLVFFTTGSIEFITNLLLGNGNGLVTKYGIQNCPNTVGFIRPYVDEFLKQLPIKQAAMRKLVFAASPKNTLKAGALFWFLHKVFSLISFTNLLIIVDLIAFTLPIVYKSYQTEIDQVVKQIIEILQKNLEVAKKQACEKAKPTLQSLDKKLGPVSKLIKSKLNIDDKKNESESTAASSSAPAAATSGSEFPSVPASQPISEAINAAAEDASKKAEELSN
ncbi:hypothetical protein TPHA_0C01950 [Tetrapisispora phaffii CBS 4417]|uniref:Reticulon-like protein n=1 Tax=Tetrapisispora phaffii (strain ATCC 24235 / CBS 4417 / NBRC 1672 / NRRL Y-8282 / UCD 70-5) TaxID=1071381 RepID=G8BRH4_TETPH|nr:hypothetical protein TPHA_0C01950 [Tetrapisispora phaffii CBS 4417]CCE62350.1 hypothetical protein TPHA_0C01950 [Tetrapisispora phaffii CBS 4417]